MRDLEQLIHGFLGSMSIYNMSNHKAKAVELGLARFVKPNEVVADEPLALLETAYFPQKYKKSDITSYITLFLRQNRSDGMAFERYVAWHLYLALCAGRTLDS